MRKITTPLLLSLSAILIISSCHKEEVNAKYYEGIYYKAGSMCPGLIKITQAPKSGMITGRYFTVDDKKLGFADQTAVWFKVKSYKKDDAMHTANCNWGTYVVVLKEIHEK